MKFDLRSLIFPFGVLLAIPFAAISLSLGTTSEEAPFVAKNSAAMPRTMADTDVTPFSDVDNNFVAKMVPLHQGAIDMAQALLRRGRNEQLKRRAQEMIVTQQEEIGAMHLDVGRPLPLWALAPFQPSPVATPASMPQHSMHRREDPWR